MPTLTYCDVDGVERSCELGAASVIAGRSPECNIRSEDGRVSRRHARFFIESGWVWVEDLGSANGVWVGAQRVTRSPVPVGEMVVAGSLIFRVVDPMVVPQVPVGLHAQLSEWLISERKTRQTIAAERDAFATRVGEVHEELNKAREAASRGGPDAEKRAGDAERRAGELEKRVVDAERRAREAENRASAAETRVAIAESRATMAEQAAARKAAAAPAAAAAVVPDAAQAARISELEGELERVRRRLTETDAELDELDRLKEAAGRTQATLADEQRQRRELEHKLAEAQRARPAAPAVAAAPALPAGFGDQVAALGDSIAALRASMRAISDETAVMEQSESVQVVSAAATTAAEEIERARDALRALSAVAKL